MGRDLFEGDATTRAFLRAAEERLPGVALRRLMTEGPAEELTSTQNAQPAILFVSLALLRLLEAEGVRANAVAGHSLGEFAGLVAAGGLDPLDALQTVHGRGQAMVATAPAGGAMAAVLGLEDQVLERVLGEHGGDHAVVAANYNAPGQVVVSGTAAGLASITPFLLRAGARRIVPLEVSAAFHSPQMARAAEAFRTVWDRVALKSLSLPQVFNVDAQVHSDAAQIRELMLRQLTSPVRWSGCVRNLWELGVRTFVEVGPRRTLTGLVKKIQPEASTHNVEDLASLRAFLLAVHA
jgi:[acyl-carrier-protein] S-malonyltransferase